LSAAGSSPVPQGYGQRVTLERGDAKELGQGLAAGLAAPREPNARLNKSIADPNAESNGLAQQRVLFLFRIADAPAPATRPLAGAAGQSDAGAKSNEPAAVNAAPPVPAPANAGGSPK
jgi:hypothetical protein